MDALNEILNMIPQEVAGIETSYIGLGLVLVLILFWGISKAKKSTPKRELEDLVPEDVESSDYEETDEATSSEEDGFMPTDIDSGENEPAVLKIKEVEEVPEPRAETPVPKKEEKAHDSVAKKGVARKKRESTRAGRSITKGDFSDFNGKRLLIAEDNLINQKVIRGVLNDSGIDIVMADDGQFVLDILAEDNSFEIILMDAHMPRVDGFEATREIRKNSNYEHIAVVALSGDTASDDIRHMREAGMEEHLEKPLKMDALYDVMSIYFSNDEEDVEVEAEQEVQELEIAVDVNELATLDYDAGLVICGNDETMYKELLKEFFVTYRDSSKKMHAALVAKEYDEAKNILIDVKGTSSNIGALQFIYTVDAFLEALAKEDTKQYGKLFKDYQAHLLALLKSIQVAFKS